MKTSTPRLGRRCPENPPSDVFILLGCAVLPDESSGCLSEIGSSQSRSNQRFQPSFNPWRKNAGHIFAKLELSSKVGPTWPQALSLDIFTGLIQNAYAINVSPDTKRPSLILISRVKMSRQHDTLRCRHQHLSSEDSYSSETQDEFTCDVLFQPCRLDLLLIKPMYSASTTHLMTIALDLSNHCLVRLCLDLKPCTRFSPDNFIELLGFLQSCGFILVSSS